MIIEAIKNKTPIYTPAKIDMPAPEIKKENIKDTIPAYFIKNNMHKPRKKDGNITRGECVIEIDNEIFTIIQGDETITNNIASIYYFDIWRYKGEIYYKFYMRSHNEYMFKDIDTEVDVIADQLDYLNIEIKDNR